ncbi:MAG: type III secretion system export apparatus subunit SctV [Janthinobacterium lividum]
MKPELPLIVLVLAIVLMLILPLPPALLDVMIAVNLSVAILLIVTVLNLHSPLALSSFPGVLLLTTLFRLALSVSTTRKILLEGNAGHIVETFGRYVVGGNLVVGLTVFFILTIVQFIVVTKGAERVAEVGARFSLDGLPGKQMAIDGDLRAGIIDGATAMKKRESLGRESQFYGAMDGALKFVKGDAIAGIVIVIVNLIGGIAIGVAQRHMSFGKAMSVYSVLTIGDGLVGQIPSLLISVAAGIVVTRVADPLRASSASRDIAMQLFADPNAAAIAGVGIVVLGFAPGMPLPVFAAIGGTLLLRSFARARRKSRAAQAPHARGSSQAAGAASADSQAGEWGDRTLADPASFVDFAKPLEVQICASLYERHGASALDEAFATLQTSLITRTGIPYPLAAWRVSDQTPRGGYRLLAYDVPAARGLLRADSGLVVLDQANPSLEPRLHAYEVALDGARHSALLVPPHEVPALEAAGFRVARGIAAMTEHLLHVLLARGSASIGVQETHGLLTRLEETYPKLVQEIRRLMTDQSIAEVLQRLAGERVSIRNLRAVIESLVQWAGREKDIVVLTEYARLALSPQITHQWVSSDGVLYAYLLGPEIEELVRNAVRQTSSTNYLALDPDASAEIVSATAAELEAAGGRPEGAIVLTTMEIRRYVRKVLEAEFPEIAVLAYQEITLDVEIQALGRIMLPMGSKWQSPGVDAAAAAG